MDVFLSTLLNTFGPAIIDMLGVALAGLIGWIALLVRQKIGLDIQNSLIQILHRAVETGAQNAVGQGLVGPDAVTATLNHVQQSIPQTLGKLKPSEQVLVNLAVAKLGSLVQGVMAR